MMLPGTATGATLARILQESREEIAEEWLRLQQQFGLPTHRRQAREDRPALSITIDQILELTIAYLTAGQSAERDEAREGLLALYRQFGRIWAEATDAEPSLVVSPSRSMQAVSQVLLTRHASALSSQELLNCILTLNALGTDLAMARIYGYLSFKEELLAKRQETVSNLLDELTRVQMKERQALALELHDSLAQHLVSIFSEIQRCEWLLDRDLDAAREELQRLKRLGQDTIRYMRTMIRDLHFGMTTVGSGLTALTEYISELEADTGVRHKLRLECPLSNLSPAQEMLVIRIMQEALINAHRHASADCIEISGQEVDNALVFEIRDNGRGFIVEEAMKRSRQQQRFGLIGMEERAQLLGASLRIESHPGCGTSIRLSIPKQA